MNVQNVLMFEDVALLSSSSFDQSNPTRFVTGWMVNIHQTNLDSLSIQHPFTIWKRKICFGRHVDRRVSTFDRNSSRRLEIRHTSHAHFLHDPNARGRFCHECLRTLGHSGFDEIMTVLYSSSSSSGTSTCEKVEVRPGRALHYQKIIISSIDWSVSADPDAVVQHTLHLLMVHGSCGASSQFRQLIDSLQHLLFTTKKKPTQLVCHLFDAWGCGQSSDSISHKPFTKEYHDSFCSEQLLLDLEAVILYIHTQQVISISSFFILAHSYGVSQVLQLLLRKITNIDNKGNKWIPIQGLIMISGGLRDLKDPLTRDGGHFLFRYFPTFLLKRMQPMLTQNFIQHAIHPQNITLLLEDATKLSNSNDMNMCKAFYTQQRYVSSEQVTQVCCDYSYSIQDSASSTIPHVQYPRFLLIHGKDDHIFPLSKAELFYEAVVQGLEKRASSNQKEEGEGPKVLFHVVDLASHQVFQEQNNQVATLIWDFIIQTNS